MTKANVAAVVLAAGKGTRMKSARPKALHPLAGLAMIRHLLATVECLEPHLAVVVLGPGMDEVAEAVRPHRTVVQAQPLGTGHAVLAAKPALAGFTGDVLVLFGDTPLITKETLERLLVVLRAKPAPAVVVLGFHPADPAGYGRLVTGSCGMLEAIVEERDAHPAERALTLCNSGVMAVDGKRLFPLLERVDDQNAKGEYYLTSIVALARAEGLPCAYVEAPAEELLGINSRADLALAEAVVQRRLRARAMEGGATLIAPETVWLSHDTRLGRDVTIAPHVVFGLGVEVADGVEIRGFCHIEGARIAAGAVVGPFARLRPGAEIGAEAHIGNFVEVKNTRIGEGAKANHLAYLGDARVGAGANIGAGTVTCNYDGYGKYVTEIGKGAFIGTNSSLVAPVRIGDDAYVGTGSVITRDVPDGAWALARARQEERPGWSAKFRARKRAGKTAKAGG
ncbi:MAG: bifunctional UDP-N-acetylglucosamine diphosphorylase/glucosamine-1-phosphate N-acetyltransferase GlmU [Alphaproteobacteria bacterium]